MIAQLSFALLPIAATFGWWAGRKEHQKNARGDNARFRHDYFRGLNYLINEQPDKAVDVFIKLLEVDTDTVEMHLALGNLFRRRGEVDRAIRVHQNLIARPQLSRGYRAQALSALGQDYLSAGVLDRAERLFIELTELGENHQTSLRFLLNIYQQEKDWEKAIKTAKHLAQVSNESMRVPIAQYYCELALEARKKGQLNDAHQHLKRAESVNAACVRASLIRADLESAAGNDKDAVKYYKRVVQQNPDYISEIVEPIAACYRRLGDERKLMMFLQSTLKAHPTISLVLGIADGLRRHGQDFEAIAFMMAHIKQMPSLRGVDYLIGIYIANAHGETKDNLIILQEFIRMLSADKPVYQCAQCGFSGKTLFWLCPSCHSWMTVKPIKGIEGN